MLKTIVNHLQHNLAIALVLSTLVTGVAELAPAQQPGNAHKRDPIVGTWLVSVAAEDDSPSFTVFEVYSASGTVTAIDNQAPSGQETTAIGSWRRVGQHKYYESQWQFLYNPDGSFYGTWMGEIEDDIDASGTRMPSSPFTYKIIDANGIVLSSGRGQSTAIRMPSPRGPQP
jgi:hypothetical protein